MRFDNLRFDIRVYKKRAQSMSSFKIKTGNDLLSQAASRQVSSALESLTSVFGMGTGVSSPLLSPDLSLAPRVVISHVN